MPRIGELGVLRDLAGISSAPKDFVSKQTLVHSEADVLAAHQQSSSEHADASNDQLTGVQLQPILDLHGCHDGFVSFAVDDGEAGGFRPRFAIRGDALATYLPGYV